MPRAWRHEFKGSWFDATSKADAYVSETKELEGYSINLQEVIAKVWNESDWNGAAIKKA